MKKEKKKNKKKGFTLIEILVVVLIIGVLAAIALPSYMRSVERSRAAGPITNLGSIAKAQKSYRMGTEHYTNDIGNLDISLKDESNGEDATGNTFESEYFTYKVYGDDKAVATATRKDVSEDKKYELSVNYATGQIYCRPITNKTCIDLGLEEGQDYNQVPWDTCETWGSWQTSCYTREIDGRTEYRRCYDHSNYGGGLSCQIETYDENGSSTYSCYEEYIVNGVCTRYSNMHEYNNNSEERWCQQINANGQSCDIWSDWQSYGVA